jgi:hypothetical protein
MGRWKGAKETGYEHFVEEVINPRTGDFYPERDNDGGSIRGTGATYYITDIYLYHENKKINFYYVESSLIITIVLPESAQGANRAI